jgi:hypothetical protein
VTRSPNLLDFAPKQAAEWEENDERIVLVRPRPRGAREWLPYLLAPKRVRLDPLGSFCWRHIDGNRTAGEIAALFRREFGEESEPAEERVGRFLQSLRREALVRFPELP